MAVRRQRLGGGMGAHLPKNFGKSLSAITELGGELAELGGILGFLVARLPGWMAERTTATVLLPWATAAVTRARCLSAVYERRRDVLRGVG